MDNIENVQLKEEKPPSEILETCYKFFGHESSKTVEVKNSKNSYFMFKTITFTIILTSVIIINRYVNVENVFKVSNISILNKITYISFLAIFIFSSTIITYHIL